MMLHHLNESSFQISMNPLALIRRAFFIFWIYMQVKLIYSSILFERRFPNSYKIIRIVIVPIWYSWVFIYRVTYSTWKKIHRSMMVIARFCSKIYTNDEVLNEISITGVELKPEDIKLNSQILNDVVRNRVVDYMKIVDDDFDDLFQAILYGGSFYKDLKVSQPDEFDLCLMIDLSRSIEPELIKIEPDKNAAAYVKIKICQNEFEENENFWRNLLNEDNYLNQNKFREWIHSTLKKALTAFSGGRRPEGYVVKHRKNVYCINFRPKGPALTLTVIRKNNWRKIEVDLVPCLVFGNQFLPGFRPRKSKKWIAVAKPLQDASIENREILWRAGFQEDEKRILAEPIKPIIKLVKKLRDVQGWIHLKSYFIETLFMHELDDPVFRFIYPKFSRKAVFVYMLKQLQRKLEKKELLYYWHEGFNLFDKANSLVETSEELKRILDEIDENLGNEDEFFWDIFYPPEDTNIEMNLGDTLCNIACFLLIFAAILYRLYVDKCSSLPVSNCIDMFINKELESFNNWATTIDLY